MLGEAGIHFVDAGVSGGVWGLQNGYGADGRRRRRRREPAHAGPRGAQARGRVRLRARGQGRRGPLRQDGPQRHRVRDHAGLRRGLRTARGAPTWSPMCAGAFCSWREGTVIRSWLLDLLCKALNEDPGLEKIRGVAQDSGEGRWTVQAAIDHAVPMPAISAPLFARFASRQDDSPAMKVVAALRNQFGGHAVTARDGHEAKPHEPRRLTPPRSHRPRQRRSLPSVAALGALRPRTHRLPVLRRGGPDPRARGEHAARRERPGQDERGRGGRLPGHAGQSPGRQRRPAGPHGAERAILRGAVTSAGRDSLVEIEINPGRANRARLNRTPVSRPRQVLGVLRTVLFAPEDLALVKGDPGQRRRYLDDLLVARAPRYAAVRGGLRAGAAPAHRPAQVAARPALGPPVRRCRAVRGTGPAPRCRGR